MERIVRRKLEMAVRVRDFSRAHPSTDANYASVLGRLEEGIERMSALSIQQQDGYAAARASAERRRRLRRRLHYELLRHLVTVAEVASRERPGLAERFRLPPTHASREALATLARRMLEEARVERELFERHGMAARLLDDLAAAIAELDLSVTESNEARREHVGARAELERVSGEVTALVGLLDGLNRYRFGEDGELRAAWESARRVVAEGRGQQDGAAPPAGVGEVTPAA